MEELEKSEEKTELAKLEERQQELKRKLEKMKKINHEGEEKQGD